MNYLQKFFWDMQKACISYGRKNEAAWISNAVIDVVFKKLEANSAEVDASVKAQAAADTSGSTAKNLVSRNALGKKIYKIERRLSFFAKTTKDALLKAQVNAPESDFTDETDTEYVARYSKILSLARQYLSKMTAHKITAAELDALDAELLAVQKLPTDTEMVTSDRTTATRSIKELRAEAHEYLDQIDDGFEGMVDDETFLDGWFAVRKIKGRHKSKAASVTETEAAKTTTK
jgi:hypothetical protein